MLGELESTTLGTLRMRTDTTSSILLSRLLPTSIRRQKRAVSLNAAGSVLLRIGLAISTQSRRATMVTSPWVFPRSSISTPIAFNARTQWCHTYSGSAEVRLEMGWRYAYYFPGTVVPPKIIDTFVFLGAQRSVYAGTDIRGNAELGYESERKKLISTITYPGLSTKGIAIVGPSLDLWSQLAGEVTVSERMKIGAKYTMDPIEMYMPNDDATRQKASSKMKNFDTDQAALASIPSRCKSDRRY
jgi:hypothetical protein